MLEGVTARLGASERLVTRQIDLAATNWRHFGVPLRAVVSSLAVHHLGGAGKRALFADIFAGLASGGVFVLADILTPARPVGWRLAARMWDEEVKRRSHELHGDEHGFTLFEDALWNDFHRGAFEPLDKPSTLTDHLRWLDAAGFVDVDVHWLLAGQMVLSAWKP
jgi:tRNA (cmo5U34)-methyltransferase